VFKAIGRKVVFEDTITEVKGNKIKSGANAYYDPETNEYHIALDGIGLAYMYFAVHETVHDIAANNPLGYENLRISGTCDAIQTGGYAYCIVWRGF